MSGPSTPDNMLGPRVHYLLADATSALKTKTLSPKPSTLKDLEPENENPSPKP